MDKARSFETFKEFNDEELQELSDVLCGRTESASMKMKTLVDNERHRREDERLDVAEMNRRHLFAL